MTLLEVVIVMSIIVIFSAMTLYNYRYEKARRALRLSAQQLATDLISMENKSMSGYKVGTSSIFGIKAVYNENKYKLCVEKGNPIDYICQDREVLVVKEFPDKKVINLDDVDIFFIYNPPELEPQGPSVARLRYKDYAGAGLVIIRIDPVTGRVWIDF